jgi:hypothetical protein
MSILPWPKENWHDQRKYVDLIKEAPPGTKWPNWEAPSKTIEVGVVST